MNFSAHPTRRAAWTLALGAVLALAAGTALAVPFIRTIEKDVETSSSEVRIPAQAPATVVLTLCGNACPNALALTAKTQAFIGRKAVTLKALHDYTVARAVGVTLFYDPITKELNRIVADE